MTPADHLDAVPVQRHRRPLRRALHHYTNLAVDFVHYTDSMANNAEASGLRISPLSL